MAAEGSTMNDVQTIIPHETEILRVGHRRGRAVDNSRARKSLLELNHLRGCL